MGVDMATPAEALGVLAYFGFALMMLAILVLLIPRLAMQARRFHKMDQASWMVPSLVIRWLARRSPRRAVQLTVIEA